jgi:hypothetical protein
LILASILLGWLACGATCFVAGLAAVRALRIEANRPEALCLGFALGSAITSTLTLAFAVLFFAREWVFLGMALAAALGGRRLLPWLRGLQPADWRSIPASFRILLSIALIAYGGLYLLHALEPGIAPDTYHLGFVNAWNSAHGMTKIVDCYAALPQGVEMLFLFAFSIGRHSAAALVHFLFLMLLPLTMALYGIRFGIDKGAAAFAAIVVFVTPLVGWDGSIAYNDVALALAAFAVLYLAGIWRSSKSAGPLVAAGLLAGYCAAIKYTGALVFVPLAGVVAWELRREWRAALRALWLATGAAALAPMPYLIRNWIWYRNPVAFFANSIFPNPYFSAAFERSYIRDLAHWHGVTWSELPKELTFGGPKLFYNLGPIYALAPIALAGLCWKKTRLPALFALAAGCAYAGNKDPRFLIPILSMAMMSVGFVVSRLPRGTWALWLLAAAQVLLIWPQVSRHSHRIQVPFPNLAKTNWKAALRLEPEERYLAQFDYYDVAREIERQAPGDEPVLDLGGGVAVSYTKHFLIDSYHSTMAERATSLFYANEDSPSQYRWRWTAVFPATAVRQVRVLQDNQNGFLWSVRELRLLRDGKQIPAAADWRADATANREDVDQMFDGMEWTSWSSREAMRPGMSVGVELRRPVTIDSVEMLSGNGPWESKMHLELTDAGGRKVTAPSAEWRAEPPADLRRDATRTLKRQGIQYVLIVNNTFHARPLRASAPAWGMREVCSMPSAGLYRID